MNTSGTPLMIKYLSSRYILYCVLCCIPILSSTASKNKLTKATSPQKATKQDAVRATSKEEIRKAIKKIKDKDLKDFVKSVYYNGENPYPEVDLDIWLLKAIEEPQNELLITKYLAEKGFISKSLAWFSKIDRQLSTELPMHRAAYLGKVDIVKFLLKEGVTKYDSDDMFILGLKGRSSDMIKLLLKEKIFDEKKLYGSLPSIMPELLTVLFFGCVVPLAVWVVEMYGMVTLPELVSQYLAMTSFAISILILFHAFINMPEENTEGISYLHILSTVSIRDDDEGIKANNIAQIAKLLLRHGANPNQKGSYIQELDVDEIKKVEGFTPLHGAVKWGNIELVKVLVWHGANVNAVAVLKSFERENTMSSLEDDSFVMYLPFWGSVESKTLNAYTPLDFAVIEDQKEVYDYLKSLKGSKRARHYKNLLNFLS